MPELGAGEASQGVGLGKVEGRNLNPRLVPPPQNWGPFAGHFWGLWGRGGEGGRPALQAGRMEVPIEPWIHVRSTPLPPVVPSGPSVTAPRSACTRASAGLKTPSFKWRQRPVAGRLTPAQNLPLRNRGREAGAAWE